MQIKLIISLQFVLTQTCPRIVKRPEIKSLSAQEWNNYVSCVQLMMEADGDENSLYMQNTKIHLDYAQFAHNVPAFFPWHRWFLHSMQLTFDKICPGVIVPYWDWSQDSRSPQSSVPMSDQMYGGAGGCIHNGRFSGINSTVPDAHCVYRNNNTNIGPFYSSEQVESIIRSSTTYAQIHTSIENNPHGNFHVSVGGDQGDMSYMYSCNDPLFFAHHGYVDLIWHEWQLRNPTLANSYGDDVSVAEKMQPFGVEVQAVFDTTAYPFCYTYDRWSGGNVALPEPAASDQGGSLSRRKYDSMQSNFKFLPKVPNLLSLVPDNAYEYSAFNFTVSTPPKDIILQLLHCSDGVPLTIPDEYIKRNGYNHDEVRNLEAQICITQCYKKFIALQ